MAYHVEVTEPALHDLRAIYEFVSADKTQHTEDWFIGLREAVFSLENLPERCPVGLDLFERGPEDRSRP